MECLKKKRNNDGSVLFCLFSGSTLDGLLLKEHKMTVAGDR